MPSKNPNAIRILRRLDGASPSFADELNQLRQQLSPSGNVISPRSAQLTQQIFGEPLPPAEVVSRICEDVRQQGRPALLRYSQLLDGAAASSQANGDGPKGSSADQGMSAADQDQGQPLTIAAHLLDQAHRQASPALLECVRRIRENILTFQTAILHQSKTVEPRLGVRLDQRYRPLRRIGICVPGGAAAYPSTVLMTVVPAQAAGVDEIAIVAPPTAFGAFNSDVLAVCHELGVREIYPFGGAQAVAALAYGVQGLPPVDKIVGPGNLFVALAKKRVYGDVDIDSIAGPSEVVVIADQTTDPSHTAADLLAQAEHSPGASLLVTWDASLADRVEAQLEQQLHQLSRQELTRDSLNEFGACILVRDAEQACEVTDRIAPEHLHIATREPRRLADRIRNAGATFLGPFTPVALGDYAAGPSHVLPTGGTARWAAGLSANSFLRGSSIIEYSSAALAEIADQVSLLASLEGLTAHRRSVEIRLP